MFEVEILIAAKAKILLPEHWGQGQAYQPSTGQYCALGALWSQTYGERAEAILAAALPPFGHKSIAAYNDTHTHEDILALYDRAIENAKIIQVLRTALARIAEPYHWTKGNLARTSSFSGKPTCPNSADAFSFCAIGALGIGQRISLCTSLKPLKEALPKKKGWRSVAHFNDHPSTTHNQIVNLYKRAIRNLGGLA